MKRTFLSAALLALLASACNSLSPHEEQQYWNLMAQGAEPVVKKKPAVAGALNLLPGFGDIYTREWGAFALDFLFWWPSVVWAIPQGVMTAENINRKATIAHYTIGPGTSLGFDADRPAVATGSSH